MTTSQKPLMDKIINCPNLTSGNTACSTIIGQQSGCRMQVPEPWNGDIENAEVLFLGTNPALNIDEVYPSKDASWNSWVKMGQNTSALWDLPEAEKFFEGRFGRAICPATNTLYNIPCAGLQLNELNNSSFYYKPVRNSYWSIYYLISKIINPNCQDWSFIVSDFVHCKGPKNNGIAPALNVCGCYTLEIIRKFVNNNNEEKHSIVIVGSTKGFLKMELDFLDKNIDSKSQPQAVGCFRNGKQTIFKSDYVIFGKHVDLYTNFPAPSGSNRASCPVTFNGVTFSW